MVCTSKDVYIYRHVQGRIFTIQGTCQYTFSRVKSRTSKGVYEWRYLQIEVCTSKGVYNWKHTQTRFAQLKFCKWRYAQLNTCTRVCRSEGVYKQRCLQIKACKSKGMYMPAFGFCAMFAFLTSLYLQRRVLCKSFPSRCLLSSASKAGQPRKDVSLSADEDLKDVSWWRWLRSDRCSFVKWGQLRKDAPSAHACQDPKDASSVYAGQDPKDQSKICSFIK